MLRNSTCVIALAALLAACSSPDETIRADLLCEVGSYRTETGGIIDIAPAGGDRLRWRTIDGRVGSLGRGEDGLWSGQLGWSDALHPARIDLGNCDDAAISVSGIEGLEGQGQRLAFSSEEVLFEGAGETLAGRLVLPEGDGPVPLVVLVHGSEQSSSLDYAYLQRLMPAQGVAAFVYDKRGTGASTGEYTQDFDLLAADAAAALETALQLGSDRISSIGYLGGSQGGWVAPLAATMSAPDFVIASFGMAESPLAEDRDQVQMELREAGYDDDVLARARTVTDATGRLLATDFREGQDELDRLRREYGDEAWFQAIRGEITGEMIQRPLWQFRIGYFFLDVGTSWGHEPVPVLRTVEAPMLWVLAGNDREAPSDNTRQILTDLQGEGEAIDVALYPDTDHGIIRFRENANGDRVLLGYADGYFRLLAEWSLSQRLAGPYGDAELASRQSATIIPE
jgi:pimeloyl-ACP methyl ester carboxylesterase